LSTKRLIGVLCLIIHTVTFGSQAFATSLSTVEAWKTTMSQGDLYETKHEHLKAIQSFGVAVSMAEGEKLPAKYLTTALCRKTESELRQNLVNRANQDCDQLMSLVQLQKTNHTLDPDTEVWVLDLANAYQAHEAPDTRESCLLKLCMINKVLYGENNKEYRNARALLGKYYELGQTVKAAQIQSVSEAAVANQAKQSSADPMGQAATLNQLALHNKIAGKLEEAKIAELRLLDIAKTNPGVADGTPAYYACLGCIALIHDKKQESQDYFSKSAKACSKLKSNKQKQVIVTGLLSRLADSVKFDKNPQIPDLASKELRQLLILQQTLSDVPEGQIGILGTLAEALSNEHKLDEACECLSQSIALAARQKASIAQLIPELYMHLAQIRGSQKRTVEMNEAFSHALKAETDKVGFHATKVLVFWGCITLECNNLKLASEKLNLAAKQADALPVKDRGTLLIDSLYGLRAISVLNHDKKKETSLVLKLIPEINAQIALNSNLGPNFWHRLQRDRFIW
jgi:hypothetical protein